MHWLVGVALLAGAAGLFAVGRCDGVLSMLDHAEIDHLRKLARERC